MRFSTFVYTRRIIYDNLFFNGLPRPRPHKPTNQIALLVMPTNRIAQKKFMAFIGHLGKSIFTFIFFVMALLGSYLFYFYFETDFDYDFDLYFDFTSISILTLIYIYILTLISILIYILVSSWISSFISPLHLKLISVSILFYFSISF